MTIRHLKLYHYPASRSARVRWALEETVGSGYALQRVDLYGGEQYGDDYLAVNPNHCVPTLEITFADGSTRRMIESGAIVAYLADAYPEKGLAPPADSSPARMDYLQALHFASTWMDMMLWQVRVHEHVLHEDQRDERTIARYRRKFAAEAEPQVAARLGAGGFICGARFTAADCVAGHTVTWARGYGLCQHAIFRDYIARLSRRPAFVAAFADAREFRKEVPPGEGLVTRFTG